MKAAQLLGILGLICCSDGLEMHCDIREGGAPCHGPLGGSLIIKLMGENTNVPKWTLKKDTITILKWEEKFKSGNDKSRYFFGRQNGSLTIASLTREDAGTYLLEGFDKDGNNISHRNFRIYVEALTPSVSSLPTDTSMAPGPKNQSQIDNAGNLTIKDYWPILVGVLVAVVLLLAIGGAVVFIYRKKQKGSTDTQELTYADVSVVNHRGKWQHREAEEMVAYSEVRFAQHPARTARPREESPVYSVVQVR
ncbi:uncharacterized protein LOC128767492 isoform X3 [Synchiropus splendidus]|uniref:uncharacterized protein LOC128767492 isoform X3 n=1 Tax=Synchiropus splendidus TaxID=270530 RepID=UPI00237E67BF|nr:uncharacterized protein LOC128767492 isoform X3 [Synchiropus splendidus]